MSTKEKLICNWGGKMDINSYTFLILVCPMGKGRGNYATWSSSFSGLLGGLQIVRIKKKYPVHKELRQKMDRTYVCLRFKCLVKNIPTHRFYWCPFIFIVRIKYPVKSSFWEKGLAYF